MVEQIFQSSKPSLVSLDGPWERSGAMSATMTVWIDTYG